MEAALVESFIMHESIQIPYGEIAHRYFNKIIEGSITLCEKETLRQKIEKVSCVVEITFFIFKGIPRVFPPKPLHQTL